MNNKITEILRKYRLVAIFLGIIMFSIGTIWNESYDTELENGTLIFIFFSVSSVLILYSIFRFKIWNLPFVAIFGGLLFLFTSIEFYNQIENIMISNTTREINGTIILESYSRSIKGMSESWNYSYEFKIHNNIYRKRTIFKDDRFSKNDTVIIEYCEKFPIFSRIKKL